MAEIIALGGLTIIYVALSLLNPDPKIPGSTAQGKLGISPEALKHSGT